MLRLPRVQRPNQRQNRVGQMGPVECVHPKRNEGR